MLSGNLLIASAVVFLATTVCTAPVEEKEPEETEFEAEEGEEELSEEEEGAGTQQGTAVPKDPGQKLNGDSASQTGSDSSGSVSAADGSNGGNGRDPQAHSSGTSSHDSALPGPDGSLLDAGFGGPGDHGSSVSHPQGSAAAAASDTLSHGSSDHGAGGPALTDGQSQPADPSGSYMTGSHYDPNGETLAVYDGVFPGGSQIEAPGSESVGSETSDIETNGNGHKHLIGGTETGLTGLDPFMEGPTQTDLTGGFDSFGAGPNQEVTGIIDQSSSDFLIGLMGGIGDGFGPDTHPDTLAASLDPAQHSSGSSGSSSSSSSGPETAPGLADPNGPDYTSFDNGFNGLTHSNGDASAFDHASQSSTPVDTADPAVLSEWMPHTDHSFIDYPEGGFDVTSTDSVDMNGNGRHRPVTDIHRGDHPGAYVYQDVMSTLDHQTVATDTLDSAVVQHGVVSHFDTAAGIHDVNGHSFGLQTDIPADGGHTDMGTHVDVAGGAGELGNSLQTSIDGAAMGDAVYSSSSPAVGEQGGAGVTDGLSNYTDSVFGPGLGFTDSSDTLISGGIQTETVTGDPLGASALPDAVGTVTAEPQGIPGGSSPPDATGQTQAAVSPGEQYHTSGQGPEGAENVELEDTC